MANSLYLKNETIEFCDASITIFELNDTLKSNRETVQMFHNHSYYEIHICTGESFEISTPITKISLSRNSMLIIPPREYHYTAPFNISKNILVITFSVKQIPHENRLYDEIVERLSKISFTPFQISDSLIEQFSKFKASIPQTLGNICKTKAATYMLIYNLLHEIGVFDSGTKPCSGHQSSANDLYVLEGLINSRMYNLKTISDILGYSIKQVQRMIKNNYGMSYRELHKKMIIEDTKKFLTDYPELPLSAVALMSGFATPAAFYKAFKQLEGCSPREYKNKHRKISETSSSSAG